MDRTQTLATTVATTAADCVAVQPFYGSIGDATGKLADAGAGGTSPGAQTLMSIASVSKLVYSAYVAEQPAGALTDADVKFLTFQSGYTDFSACLPSQTVAACEAWQTNGQYEAANDGKFYYGGGHMEKHAFDNGMGAMDDAAFGAAINATLGTAFAYSQPQPAGGIYTTAETYGAFLQRIVGGQLKNAALLGPHPVCTNPHTCAAAVYSPIPSEDVHYSIGHWVEDDPTLGDGAFRSAGAFGLYPWISQDRTTWGVLARFSPTFNGAKAGAASLMCGRQIRAAWGSGEAR